MVLPGLKAELNSRLIAIAKELQKYGKIMESKVSNYLMIKVTFGELCM